MDIESFSTIISIYISTDYRLRIHSRTPVQQQTKFLSLLPNVASLSCLHQTSSIFLDFDFLCTSSTTTTTTTTEKLPNYIIIVYVLNLYLY